ncbi:hypothetical protein [Nitrosomonas aestuarii]|uniref:hypothetical protein n=1 Tax=Nitrosomonas aestuarii TaxID=52441 RepID=UPI000D4A5C0F|nr:hypothetical protein [Nitrosomonas aestuarii]PTN11097.1 hypothetical protein C8R11_11336 [Nitrosomonas aestuarii]
MALRYWSEQYSAADESLAIDGKTMRSAIDNEGKQVHRMSAIGHETLNCYTQKSREALRKRLHSCQTNQ